MKKKDWFLIALILIAAGVLALFFYQGEQNKEKVVIFVGKKQLGSYSLNKNEEIEIVNHRGRNVVEIKDGKVRMKEADCPHGYCKGQGQISKPGQVITCLPHQVVVEIVGGKKEKVDGYSH